MTAQLSQAGEDAKRAVLSRTNLWFAHGDSSNLNTVCTIKSAPPRSPEVLNLLATKSGWLYKRNEQHVWQARWCCVVPHMFLYYFDAHPSANNGSLENGPGSILPPPTAQQQEEWNRAVSQGYNGKLPKHERRSHFPASFFPSGSDAPPDHHHENAVAMEGLSMDDPQNPPTSTLQQPTGIIDLECYTTVNRSSFNSNVLQLAGDDTLNPDLRTFYFCACEEEASQEWTQAFLHNRHAALLDECDAYKQVCDGFAQQLQMLHQELDESGVLKEEAQQELYRLRSQQEDLRRSCWRLSEEALFSTLSLDEDEGIDNPTVNTRSELRHRMEQLRAQDWGVTALVQVLIEHCQQLEQACSKEYRAKIQLQNDLRSTGQSDQAKVLELESQLKALQEQYQAESESWKVQTVRLQTQLSESQKELQDIQKALSSTQLEMTMNGSQQRNQVKELTQHKKILKKEVIDLRNQLEATKKELAAMQHEKQQQVLVSKEYEQKNVLLERYVEKMESQVKVQQNMMEMISHSGLMSTGGSVYGGGSVMGPGRNVVVIHNDGPNVEEEDEDDLDDEEDDEREMEFNESHARRQSLNNTTPSERRTSFQGRTSNRSRSRRGFLDDYDNKSHMSELTEDRTQRHFETMTREFRMRNEQRPSPHHVQKQSPRNRPGPPSFIIGVNNLDDTQNGSGGERDEDEVFQTHQQQDQPYLDTINKSAMSLPPVFSSPPRQKRDNGIPKSGGSLKEYRSDSPETKLSIAQQSRIEADRKTTPVKARLDEKTKAQVDKQSTSPPRGKKKPASSGNSASGLWRRMEEAVLGPMSDYESDESSSCHSTRVTDYTEDDRVGEEEKKTEGSPLVSQDASLALHNEMFQPHFLRFPCTVDITRKVKATTC